MNQQQLHDRLKVLLVTGENEVIEFKQTLADKDTHTIGKYFSALSNEANLSDCEDAWLVLGVSDRNRRVAGTNFRMASEYLERLRQEVANTTEPSLQFKGLHVLHHEQGRAVMMQIPAAPNGIPIAWKGYFYGRNGEILTSLALNKLDEIRAQTSATDWSAQMVPDATLDDLDEKAVQKARERYASKLTDLTSKNQVMNWPLEFFLDKAQLTDEGKITRTTLLLLGKESSASKLLPHPAKLVWRLEGDERAYEMFSLPFILTSQMLFDKIRNFQTRILPAGQMVAVEVSKYDQRIVLEALYNCIAHQDYTRNARISVREYSDRLVFESEGAFFDGTPNDYITSSRLPRRYRNAFLATAMAQLKMIDTMGLGIHSIHIEQAKRYFPMPDYDLEENDAVKLTIHGKIIDLAYSRLLIEKTDIPLEDILALDRVQKNLPLTDDTMIKHLRKEKLIEGRKPNFHVSALVAAATSQEAEYIHIRGQNDEFYSKLITDYLFQFGSASRAQLDKLLADKMSDLLDYEQKKRKVKYLLTKLRRAKVIENRGSNRAPKWMLVESGEQIEER